MDGDGAGAIKAICDSDGVYAFVEEGFALFEKSTSKNWGQLAPRQIQRGKWRTNDAGGSVANFLVLALGQLDQELCDLVLNLHLAENRCAVVGDCYFAIGGDEDLVEACADISARRTPRMTCNGPRGPREVLTMLATVLAARIWPWMIVSGVRVILRASIP